MHQFRQRKDQFPLLAVLELVGGALQSTPQVSYPCDTVDGQSVYPTREARVLYRWKPAPGADRWFYKLDFVDTGGAEPRTWATTPSATAREENI